MKAYRWRVVCDVRKPPERSTYGRFMSRKSQADLIRQAEWCWTGGLISDRCRFGPRRLTLEGSIESPSLRATTELALDVTRWTLASVYGMEEFRDPRDRLDPPRADVRVKEEAS